MLVLWRQTATAQTNIPGVRFNSADAELKKIKVFTNLGGEVLQTAAHAKLAWRSFTTIKTNKSGISYLNM